MGSAAQVERNAEILRRLGAGESFRDIAAAMGLTRNVVASVAYRQGQRLDRRRAAPRPSARRANRATDQGVPPQAPVGCRWIEGDPGDPDWRYCQAPRQRGSSYCAEHHARCHLPLSAARTAA